MDALLKYKVIDCVGAPLVGALTLISLGGVGIITDGTALAVVFSGHPAPTNACP